MKNEDYKYKFNTQNTAIIITNYIGKQKDIVIPNEIEDLPVTVISTFSFASKQINSVIIPEGIKSIG